MNQSCVGNVLVESRVLLGVVQHQTALAAHEVKAVRVGFSVVWIAAPLRVLVAHFFLGRPVLHNQTGVVGGQGEQQQTHADPVNCEKGHGQPHFVELLIVVTRVTHVHLAELEAVDDGCEQRQQVCGDRVREEQHVVALADARSDPRAVVVVNADATVADFAMVNSGCLNNETGGASCTGDFVFVLKDASVVVAPFGVRPGY